jgi:hypothetical protein
MKPTDPAYRGQEHYSSWFLRIYDVLVLAIYGPLVWRCPTRRLPGPMSQRSGVIRTLASHLEPDGVLFGATLLGSPEVHTWLSRMALRQPLG